MRYITFFIKPHQQMIAWEKSKFGSIFLRVFFFKLLVFDHPVNVN